MVSGLLSKQSTTNLMGHTFLSQQIFTKLSNKLHIF